MFRGHCTTKWNPSGKLVDPELGKKSTLHLYIWVKPPKPLLCYPTSTISRRIEHCMTTLPPTGVLYMENMVGLHNRKLLRLSIGLSLQSLHVQAYENTYKTVTGVVGESVHF